ncbi:hypothetical protein KI688_006851 [Linnemannia hyalina]|uniref:Uncharacterized protein n=1 Tax=Linnemannia hyalina TaxID=64524 RepID=A0A9P8BM19_9FUNG|nr:hypothetical protein KI688_009805 [Linnemannia hyalina]KAG9060715.1 hypothetical protein KI688_009806 [Linnemannia hyalina]KAG9061012.1 hypothetical protein KI688_007842 [Linnemannia hyalina]KAG9061702.1 hypothetical protein KI688_006851 [Linnemannia hyalina]
MKAVRLNTIINALRGLAESEPEIRHVQLPGLEEQLEAMGRTSATTPVGDSLIDALRSRVEAKDQHAKMLQTVGISKTLSNNPVQHIYTPQDLDNAHSAKPATRPLLRDFEQTKANSKDRRTTELLTKKAYAASAAKERRFTQPCGKNKASYSTGL